MQMSTILNSIYCTLKQLLAEVRTNSIILKDSFNNSL